MVIAGIPVILVVTTIQVELRMATFAFWIPVFASGGAILTEAAFFDELVKRIGKRMIRD